MSVFALDVGGSHLAAALVEAGRVRARRTIPVPSTRSFLAYLPAIRDALAGMTDEAGSRPDRAAIAFPALIDVATGRVSSTPEGKYEDAAGYDLVGWARTDLGLPLRLELDARVALLGEWCAGALRGTRNAAILTLGTGIGSAAIVDGRPLGGARNQAGALAGHLMLSRRGRRCICGSAGCAETEASGWALPDLARAAGLDPERLTPAPAGFAQLFALADAGDAGAICVRDDCIAIWGLTVLNLIHAYDPEAVVLAGGVMASADMILPAVRAFVATHAWLGGAPVRIEAGALGTDAALIGGEALWEGV